jgi:hypothetical protein
MRMGRGDAPGVAAWLCRDAWRLYGEYAPIVLDFMLRTYQHHDVGELRQLVQAGAANAAWGEPWLVRLPAPWITGLADRGIQAGLFTAEEVKAGHAASGSSKLTPPVKAEMVPALVRAPRNYERPIANKPAYRIGETIRTVTDSPEGHTRLPRYARGRNGVIVLYHGSAVFADSNANGNENPQHLYAVRFSASELWGREGDPRASVTLDLYEPYMQHAWKRATYGACARIRRALNVAADKPQTFEDAG